MNANPSSSWMPAQQHHPHDHDEQLLPELTILPQSPAGEEPHQQPPSYEAAAILAVPPPAPASRPLALSDHKVRISEAIRLSDDAERDTALISALRGVSTELEAAEEDHLRAEKRVGTARELFDWATGALSGYAKTREPKGEDLIKRGRKRKGEKVVEVDYDEKFMPPEEGPLIPPLAAISGGGMTEEQVVAHRDAFYRKLCDIPYAELSSFTPPSHLVNLKSRAQLEECIYIVNHWDTGTTTCDQMDFRRQHKSFYTKMKMSKENIGRRTGHHLRDVAGNEGRKAFCRFGKSDESLMYISVEELYDAIFEIHCLTGHRGWQASKKIANLKYANLPQDQIRYFIESCPICCARKSSTPKRQKTKFEEDETII
eukprot:CAMPEP_0172307108 /NCGR_PEP_ID=MMETSP1058-20130122/8029_1 /TAXON_ID=83371 /ORGANISM="Detonula confervacea, Strain CCMP 353" /LENGTH=371 /DNA_ID=CAMNT_0013019183 /DNA_START=1 /DNA_END=1116 /DNA_ORIENTATION=+